MAVKAGTNLVILDNSKEGTPGQGWVTLKNPTKISVDSGIFAFSYPFVGTKTDTGFKIKLKAMLNSAGIATKEFYFTEEASGTFDWFEREIVASTIDGDFFIKLDFPAPIDYVIVEIQWVGTFTDLNDLTVNFLPNSF